MTGTVKVSNLVKHFGDVEAVNDISFTVEEGEFFSLLGPSGCGKTTTLRCIAGFETPTEGDVFIQDEVVTDRPPYERDAGMVFQGYALFPHKSVGSNVGFGLKMENVPKEERDERIAEALELVDMPGYEDRYPSELSGGQQQRVALARALVLEPTVLLLDEPLSNLDLKLRKQMRFELQRIQNELNITTVYVTHDQEEALSMSDRVAVMNDGTIEQVSEPADLYNRPANRFVADFIGDTNLLPGTIESVNGEGITIRTEHARIEPFEVPHSATNDDITANDSILLNLRPVDLNVGANGGGKHVSVTGEVTGKKFLGKSTKLLVDIEEQELLVEAAGRAAQEHFTGDEVEIGWKPDECFIIRGV